MSKQLIQHYSQLRAKAEVEESKLKATVNKLVAARLLAFSGVITCIIVFFGSTSLVILSTIFCIGVFVFTIQKHSQFIAKRKYYTALILLYHNEISALNGDVSFANNGNSFKTEDHEFSHDIDLFGEGSFYQKINRTATLGGAERLANLLSSNNIEEIAKKQEAVIELGSKESWRHAYTATALVNVSEVSSEVIINWFTNKERTLPTYVKYLIYVFPLISIALLALLAVGLLSATIFACWFLLGLIITGGFLKNIAKFNTDINRIADTIDTNSALLRKIEGEQFESEILQELQKNNASTSTKSSQILSDLKKKVDLFNNRNNLIVGVFGNALLLWDVQTIFRLDNWIESYKDKIQLWFDSVYAFDAQISLANYAYNHTEHIFPELVKDSNIFLDASALGHPLLNPASRIDNDVTIQDNNFFIITGANMAGKSTFLRTVSLAIVMSNCGMPVCAKHMKYKPIQLITSMRTTDSLLDDESYFFSELKRLKTIIDAIKEGTYFIILDEILKGTNSKDKEEGSKKFVKKLISLHSCGIIATHDLGLCEISKEHPEVSNFYFDAEIVNDELFFDYTMKDGVCVNMNASFLLKKMEIV
ncbi:MAG: DNA mismatch repair ATPase MutS [Flavobacteriales bacterium]|jgi:DNA mismatch repair ATPase MutS